VLGRVPGSVPGTRGLTWDSLTLPRSSLGLQPNTAWDCLGTAGLALPGVPGRVSRESQAVLDWQSQGVPGSVRLQC